MIDPLLIQRAMARKQEKKADGFDASAFFRSSALSAGYVDTYFMGSPIVLLDKADEMFEESSIGHMEMHTSVWDMLQGDK